MNVAFIPVRGGSKSIPLKNIKKICGKPLVYWVVKAACDCKRIDKVYIATDSDVIKDTVLEFGRTMDVSKLCVIGRSEESASDTASTESAMLEFAVRYDFDNIVLIQATSPLLKGDDIERGFELYDNPGVDSVMSVVKQKRFNWDIDEYGMGQPVNYDVYNRPRRQDFDGYYVENGAFYITSKTNLLRTGNRVSGNIKLVEMCEDSYFEIDEPSDWLIIEKLMQKNGVGKQKRPEIKMLVTDCDGCLTDGGMYYSENGDELKKFNTKDGMAFKLLRERGIITGIITGEMRRLNERRAEKLGLDFIIQGCDDKLNALLNMCDKYDISLENVAYIGDDINDLEVLKNVGLSCCPHDAMNVIKDNVDYMSYADGGKGVVRDVYESWIG